MSGDIVLEDGSKDDQNKRIDSDVQAQLELLAEENRRLREESRRLRQSQYRQTALGLGALGLLAGAGSVLFPAVREVLLALTGIGLFSAVLVYFLTPERFVAASIGESVYGAHARTVEALVGYLGLEDIRIYVPISDRETRLFIPQHVDYRIPDRNDLESVIVVPDDERQRGISLYPTGNDLVAEFEQTVSGELATEPTELARQLTDALVEVFELADSVNVSPTLSADDGARSITANPDDGDVEERVTIGVIGSVYGDADIDHPVTSVIACGLAQQFEKPVVADTVTSSDSDYDVLLTVWWPAFASE